MFIADTNSSLATETAINISQKFSLDIDEGLLEVIAVPNNGYYPDLSNLRQGFGDDNKRIKWRSKQSLDFAYLMLHGKVGHEI